MIEEKRGRSSSYSITARASLRGRCFAWFLPWLIAAALGAVRCPAAAPDTLDEDLRLRLDDIEQVRRTTSLNWIDMAAEAQRYRAPRVLRIMLDPGHGGRDTGARAHCRPPCPGFYEKDVALQLAYLVRTELSRQAERRGLRLDVRLTRENDSFLALGRRVRMANDWGADLFLSLHGNSSTYAAARGFEVYFLSEEATDNAAARVARVENAVAEKESLTAGVTSILSDVLKNQHVAESSRFAESVFAAMARRLQGSGRAVRQAPFRVLGGTEMPALLLEVGYLTNSREARLLMTEPFLRRLAGAISSGILEFALRQRLG